jgi:hypothetical protein
MSIDGRINVGLVFLDREGTARLKVLTLESGTEYVDGAVAVATGTAGTGSLGISWSGYRNAAGNTIAIVKPYRLGFAWSGAVPRTLADAGGTVFRVSSKSNEVAVTALPGSPVVAALASNATAGTGTYTIMVWGSET